MYEITFLRHGESEGVRDKILQGHLDLPLTENGRAGVRRLAQYWLQAGQTFDQVIASPLQRTQETARIVASTLKLPPVASEELWIERHFGKGEGVDYQTIAEWNKNRPLPTVYEPSHETGESTWQVHLRAGRALEKLLQLAEGRYLVVSHGSILSATLHMIMGILPYGRAQPVELGLEPGHYALVRYRPETARWSLLGFNDHAFTLSPPPPSSSGAEEKNR